MNPDSHNLIESNKAWSSQIQKSLGASASYGNRFIILCPDRYYSLRSVIWWAYVQDNVTQGAIIVPSTNFAASLRIGLNDNPGTHCNQFDSFQTPGDVPGIQDNWIQVPGQYFFNSYKFYETLTFEFNFRNNGANAVSIYTGLIVEAQEMPGKTMP